MRLGAQPGVVGRFFSGLSSRSKVLSPLAQKKEGEGHLFDTGKTELKKALSWMESFLQKYFIVSGGTVRECPVFSLSGVSLSCKYHLEKGGRGGKEKKKKSVLVYETACVVLVPNPFVDKHTTCRFF